MKKKNLRKKEVEVPTFSCMVALVFSIPDVAEAAVLAAVSFANAAAFFALCILTNLHLKIFYFFLSLRIY